MEAKYMLYEANIDGTARSSKELFRDGQLPFFGRDVERRMYWEWRKAATGATDV
jgi:hypothetical protein